MASRRRFLTALLAAGAAPAVSWADAGDPAYLAAARTPDGSFALYGLTEGGAVPFRIPLDARGHAGAGHPHRPEAVAFARRPGTFAIVIDCARGSIRHRLTPPEGRQFNGHGAFAENGALLLTSEQSRETSEGYIGLWDTDSGYARMGEIPTRGIGPHELRVFPDGTIVVANGGIATDPRDRRKLNISTMRPNLAYLGLDGKATDLIELDRDLSRNSIRHLAIRADGLVGFAMQWQGPEQSATPLLGLHRRGRPPILATAPISDELIMEGYAGSVAFDGAGTEIAISSPRGGRLHRFSLDGAFLGVVRRSDVCGLAAHRNGYLASDGFGGLVTVSGRSAKPLAHHDCSWDNHIVSLHR